MTDWIFQANPKRYDVHAAVARSRQDWWNTPRYRDRIAVNDRVWLQIVGPDRPGIYYVATIVSLPYAAPENEFGPWHTDIRWDYRIDPPLPRPELVNDPALHSFRSFRGFEGSNAPVPPEIASRLLELAGPRLVAIKGEWSAAEVRAVVSDYLEMLAAEAAGQPYSKTEHRRRLQAKLSPGRTPQAIEFKHANITAAMVELGLPYIRGYKPRRNYQAELVSEIRRRVEDGQLPTVLQAAPVPEPGPGLKQAPVPRTPLHKLAGKHIDYGVLQEENRKLGSHGEHLVVQFEMEQLRQSGRTDLADRVEWAAKDRGDGLGYDVLSFDAAGNERYIEVKTTALGAQTPFYITSAELECARSHPESFALYRVYDARSNPTFYALEGDITQAIDLMPTVYRAQPKGRRKPE